MIKDIPITEARHELTSFPERLARQPGSITITRRGKPVLAIMPWEFYESLQETLAILGDRGQMRLLQKGIEEARRGKGILWKKAKRRLGL